MGGGHAALEENLGAELRAAPKKDYQGTHRLCRRDEDKTRELRRVTAQIPSVAAAARTQAPLYPAVRRWSRGEGALAGPLPRPAALPLLSQQPTASPALDPAGELPLIPGSAPRDAAPQARSPSEDNTPILWKVEETKLELGGRWDPYWGFESFRLSSPKYSETLPQNSWASPHRARARAHTHTHTHTHTPTHTPCPLSPPCKLVAFSSQSLGCDLKEFRQQQSDPGGALDRQPHPRRLGPPSRDASGGLGKHFHPLLSSTLAGCARNASSSLVFSFQDLNSNPIGSPDTAGGRVRLLLLQDSDVSLRSAVRSAGELPTVPQAGSYWGSGQPWGPLEPWPSGSSCLRNMEATLMSYFQSLQECQLGPGPQTTAPHTVLDLDSDCGSTVPLTLISGSNQT
ncbi:uncharacterized protein LOC129393577 [Pan paniscus]|uniref:uncharacterized protein LOC129393577 n=1 Tax=Pan paniscus TaxID=9597 RepID=UPI00300758BC